MSSTPASHSPEEPLSPVDSNDGEDLGPPQTSVFLRHVSETVRQSHCVSLDHLYSRSWNCRSDGTQAQQTRLLLVNPLVRPHRQLENTNIDVETVDEPANLTEPDEAAARAAMQECQEHVAGARDVPDDLIEQLDQSSWSAARRQLLRQVLAALSSYQLARRAVQDRRGAAFVARVHADRCAARVRRALAAVGWQRPLCQWLHTLMLQKLGKDMLALYLEVLQTLTSKVPSLVARLTAAPGTARHGPLSAETLAPLLRRPWDPAAHLISQHKLKRLPNNPLLVVVPSSPCHGADASQLGYGTNRLDFWHRQLSALGKVVPISECEGGAPVRGISVSESLSHILSTCRQQVSELRRPGRPLVLLGWGAAGLVAAHLALVEPVSAVVALGFPYWSPAGRRGEPDDPLLELRTPTLLLVGQAATDAAPHELELMRDRMRAETGLVVVGSADSRLLVNGRKMQREGLTQSMMDRAILEEISEFLTGILSDQVDGRRPLFPRLPTPPQQRQDIALKNLTLAREKRRKSAVPSGVTASAAPQPARRRADKPPKPGKPKKSRSRPPSARPEPEPATPTAAAAVAVAATIAAVADGDDSLSEAPIIDLIQDVDPDADADVDVDVDVVTPEPEVTVATVRPPSPPPPPPPAPVPMAQNSVKLLTTPTFRPQAMSYGGQHPTFGGRPAPVHAIRPFSGGLGVGGGPRQPRGAVRMGRAGRLKITQRPDSGPGPGARRGRGRGRGRSRQPQYGVAHDFGTPASHLPAAGRLGSAGTAGTAGVCPAAAGRTLTTVVERPPTTQQQLVYVQPSGGARTVAPTVTRDRLVVMGGGGGGPVRRQVVVSRGRARTVTYVPSPRLGPVAHRPPEHEYAVGQTRYIRTAVYPRPGRPQLHRDVTDTGPYRPPPPPPPGPH